MVMFPKVPDVPGVPPVARNATNTLSGSPSVVGVIGSQSGDFQQMKEDGPGVSNVSDAPKWGLFDKNNKLAITPDSFLGLDRAKDFRVSDYPIEAGGFESYNKVEMPFIGKIKYGKGGTEAERTKFLDEIDKAVKSLDLYTLVTPEKSYSNINVTHWDDRRTVTNGVTMLSPEVWVEEIRNTVTATFSNTQQPEGADPVNNGGVQPQSPTPSQSATLEEVS